ncbi:winged helix-turn-helix domain-containing protein [Paraglaciecola hydrolytica]|nr:winged helix-turn-helix domain-containing protein [Paraglaciecola hydrolytica]
MTSENSDNIMLGDIQISPQHNTMTKGELVCRLQPKVMALLCYLHQHNDRVVANDELLEQVWEGRVVTHNSIQKSINALRAAFAELDTSTEYVVHFSKRGYQLVIAQHIQQAGQTHFVAKFWGKPLIFLSLVALTISALFLTFVVPSLFPPKATIASLHSSQFSQVKPYVSNTGRERIIEPFTSSDRVAFIRDEPDIKGDMQSRLYIQGASGQEWQMSVARGDFVDLAWSASGRNLVAVDAHTSTEELQNTSDAPYYTFHIFTLDFKGEKLIEKNLLSHWLGKVSSVSWWDEGTLEFVAAQGAATKFARYRYNIANQNLIELESQQERGQLLATQLLDKSLAELRQLDSGMQIQLFNSQQSLVAQSVFPLPVVSMSWLVDGSGLLILFDNGNLSVLEVSGRLFQLNYAPKLGGRITRARSTDNNKSLVLTVDASLLVPQTVSFKTQTNLHGDVSAISFLAKSGGFIYTATTN